MGSSSAHTSQNRLRQIIEGEGPNRVFIHTRFFLFLQGQVGRTIDGVSRLAGGYQDVVVL